MSQKTNVTTKNREITLTNVLEYTSARGLRGVIDKDTKIKIDISTLSSTQIEILLASQLYVDLGSKIDSFKDTDTKEYPPKEIILDSLNASDILTEDIDGSLWLNAENLKNAVSATKAQAETIKNQAKLIADLQKQIDALKKAS